ncbi:MAG: DUF3027 domain-containing protein [Kineosporiaceae bacterium]|nr:DUF3027 domain-containing protein [Kineosporiaceae bacterium]
MVDNRQVPTSLDGEIPPVLPALTASVLPPALDAGPQLPALEAGPVPPAIDAATEVPTTSSASTAPAATAGDEAPASRTEPGASRSVDSICAAAVSLARQAAVDVAGADQVGEHTGVHAEGERVATHHFACLSRGYRGWHWAVTVARAPRSRTATVSEVVLLPGSTSVLAPVWLPWADRIAPGDLGATDQLPYRVDDPRLEPGYTVTDDEEADQVALWELGLGRARVLSPLGMAELAQRWYASDRGPTSDEAVHAAAACSTCGYFLPLAGRMRQVFGVCGNEWSPSDARVVSVDHGCGAHSETDVEHVEAEPPPPPILDETGYEAVVLPPREAESTEPTESTELVESTELTELTEPVEPGHSIEVARSAEPVALAAPDEPVAAPESPA